MVIETPEFQQEIAAEEEALLAESAEASTLMMKHEEPVLRFAHRLLAVVRVAIRRRRPICLIRDGKRAGLPHYRVYDLRHTFASLLLAETAPITYVSAQLGHSSPATTMRFYARWIPSQGKRWVNALDRKTDGRGAAAAAEGKLEPESGTIADRARWS